MLDELVATIETLKRRIQAHRTDLQDYESRTRVALIAPLLYALGWDVADPSQVTIEPKGPNGWCDYALLGENGRTIVVFVEAKKLADRDSPITQTVGYAVSENIQNNANVRYCASTNGDVWELYDITGQSTVMRTSIVSDGVAQCALKLLGLWRQSMADGVYTSAVEPVVNAKAAPTTMDEHPQRIAPEQVVEPKPVGAGWTPLPQLGNPKGRPQPNMLRLPDGNERTVTSWLGVLRETALWLYERGSLTSGNCAIPTSESSSWAANILSPDGTHPSGAPFNHGVELRPGVFMHTDVGARGAINRTKRLLQHFGIDPATVSLRLP